MFLGISPAWLLGQQCLCLSKGCVSLWIIKSLFACWTCMGKGQKILRCDGRYTFLPKKKKE